VTKELASQLQHQCQHLATTRQVRPLPPTAWGRACSEARGANRPVPKIAAHCIAEARARSPAELAQLAEDHARAHEDQPPRPNQLAAGAKLYSCIQKAACIDPKRGPGAGAWPSRPPLQPVAPEARKTRRFIQ
jgi:hypothetical protein